MFPQQEELSHLLYPVVGCGQGVVEATQRNYSIQLRDGDQLLTVVLLKGQHTLDVFVKQWV